MYTIKQVAQRMNVSEHTIRYYAKEGLFPFIIRDAHNVRLFPENELEVVELVLCLRSIDMPLEDVKTYVELYMQGDNTLESRYQMIRAQKENVCRRIDELHDKLDYLERKEQFYVDKLNALSAGQPFSGSAPARNESHN